MAVGAEAEVVALSAFLLNAAWAIVDRFDRCFLILALTVAISGGAVLARDLPAPPCAGPVIPVYPTNPDTPAIDVWLDQHVLENRDVPACLGWENRPATVVIAVAGRFQHDGTSDELLVRLGATSQYMSISYWSWSRQRWRNLFEKSVALSARERSAERKDFKADELQKGGQVYILQDESGPVGEVIQRVSIIDRSRQEVRAAQPVTV